MLSNFHVKQQPTSGSNGLGGGVHNVGTIWKPRADALASDLKIAYSGLSEHGYRNVASLINKTSDVSPVFIPRGANKPLFNHSIKKWSDYDSSLELGVRVGGNTGWFASEDPTGSTARDLQAFGNSDYCIEFWIYVPSYTGGSHIAAFYHTNDGEGGEGTGKGFKILLMGTGAPGGQNRSIYYTAFGQLSNGAVAFTSNNVLTAGQWQHIAVTRNGNSNANLRAFVNGIQRSFTYQKTPVNRDWDFTGACFVTAPDDGTNATLWNTVKIQDYRVYVGSAKYTSNFNNSLPESMFIKN